MKRISALAVLIGTSILLPGVEAQSPIDWDALPMLPYRDPPEILPSMNSFVAAEIQSRGCPQAISLNGRQMVRADIAVLISDEATVRATVPRAINCPTVEQYAAGIVATAARNNLLPRAMGAPGWYRASLTFDWAE